MSAVADTACGLAQHGKCPGCDCSCHVHDAQLAAVRQHATGLGVRPHLAVDLFAHLRSGREALDPAQAVRVTGYVLDLGWRPTVIPASLSRLDTSTAADTCADGQGQTVQTEGTQR